MLHEIEKLIKEPVLLTTAQYDKYLIAVSFQAKMAESNLNYQVIKTAAVLHIQICFIFVKYHDVMRVKFELGA